MGEKISFSFNHVNIILERKKSAVFYEVFFITLLITLLLPFSQFFLSALREAFNPML